MVSEAEKKAPGPSEAEVSETIDGVAAGAQKQDGDVGLTESAGPAGDAVVDKEQAAIQDDAVESDCEPGLIQDQLQEQVEQLQSELADAKDQAMRAIAESQNARRRAEKDVTNARRFALEKFVQELLPVIDNLERAMESAQADAGPDESMLQGIELTLKSFFDVLKRANVEPVDPLSEPFDPQLHEAISMVKNSEVEPNTVLNVVQKGYTLNGRLVRAAMVVVSSA